MNSRFCSLLLCVLLAGASSIAWGEGTTTSTVEGVASGEEVEAFTGGHTRAVWVVDDQNVDVFASGTNLRLMGYDSRDGLGARSILEGPANFSSPLLTPDGQRVVFGNIHQEAIFIVDFDGKNRRELRRGTPTDVWEDPETGRFWIYAQENMRNPSMPIFRFPIDDPNSTEIVWNSSPVQIVPVGGFQVSRDGTRASGIFPWPNSGSAELPDFAWRKHRDGCWPSMAPDNSHMFWTFDGAHRNLILTRPGTDEEWRIPVSTAPGINDFEVYHPRWTNHVRYFVMTGPYTMGEGRIKLTGGADHVGLYLGKFNEDFDGVEAWLRLTNTREGAFFPDVWIDGGQTAISKFHRTGEEQPKEPGFFSRLFDRLRPAPKYSEHWPVSDEGLVFLWEDNKSANEFRSVVGGKRSARLTAIGSARWGPHGEMHLMNGGFQPEEVFAKEIRAACMETSQLSVEAIVTTARVPQHGPARIISLSAGTHRRSFTVGQQGDTLVLRLQTSSSDRNGIDFNLGTLSEAEAHHILVTYKPGSLVCYMDGEIVAESEFEAGTFEDWRRDELFFGKEKGGLRYWEGFLEAVAIYNRFIDPEEAALKHTAVLTRLKTRTPIPTTHVTAEMLTRQEPPDPEDITPYRRALSVNRYRVLETTDPSLLGSEIQVAEWTLLDGEVPGSYAEAGPGTARELDLQPYHSHPQLESERLIGSGGSLDEPLYYDVVSGR